MVGRRKHYKAIRDYPMPLQYRHSALCMMMIVIFHEIRIGHAILLLDENGRLDDFAKTRGIGVTRFEVFGHHDGLVVPMRRGDDEIWMNQPWVRAR
jgi:hypothetical protein